MDTPVDDHAVMSYLYSYTKISSRLKMPPSPKPLSTSIAIPSRPYLRDEVYAALRKHIGAIAADANEIVSLREVDLARALGVSRTPVREALNRLHQEGVISFEPRRGAKVLPASMDEYICWLEIREVVEGLAAARAAKLMPGDKIAELRDLFEPFRTGTPDWLAFQQANAVFHSEMIEFSGNPLLQRLSRTYDHLAGARRKITGRLGRVAKSLAEHDAILDAIAARDSAKAEELARAHVRDVRSAASERLRDLEP